VSQALPVRSSMSIGEVLSHLRADFADVTISKIRFLEAEGLVEPERTSAGYRKFTPADVERLRYVLSAQRDHYLPLKVIKDHLDALDRGLARPAGAGGDGPVAARTPRAPSVGSTGPPAVSLPDADTFARDSTELRLSRHELLAGADIDPEVLDAIESFGLIRPSHGGTHYDANALVVARTVAAMSGFGIEPRHLRAFKTAADREVGLVEQVITPLLRQRNPAARARAEEVSRELAALSVALHAALVRAALPS
jgi:DNA-binding transcriptional MerR regulator